MAQCLRVGGRREGFWYPIGCQRPGPCLYNRTSACPSAVSRLDLCLPLAAFTTKPCHIPRRSPSADGAGRIAPQGQASVPCPRTTDANFSAPPPSKSSPAATSTTPRRTPHGRRVPSKPSTASSEAGIPKGRTSQKCLSGASASSKLGSNPSTGNRSAARPPSPIPPPPDNPIPCASQNPESLSGCNSPS